ncbi:MAG: tripartite tricarboxylate transporter substrate binding protein, partial [Bradyrhizobiaceae bacterium]|nr:tripartite tricarboxylate transporter substrate binding protein [Bradyrhizobiaceae bacterium]
VSRAFADYPERPVRIVVGFSAGASADVAARIVAEDLSKTLGQRFVVENRPGAASNSAAVGVAKAEADGYTLFLGSVANVINASLKKAASVDLRQEFEPIALICALPNILVVHPSVKATTVKELVALAKSEPHKLNFGSAGAGTSPHLSGELFKTMAGIDMVHVPYGGTAQAAQDLVGGRLHLMFAPASTALPQVEAGNLRAIAWTTAARGASLPDLPTVAESGLPGFDTSIWFGLLAPLGTPDAIRDRLAEGVRRALRSEEVLKSFRAQGIEPLKGGPAAFAEYIGLEMTKWSKVAAKAGLTKD